MEQIPHWIDGKPWDGTADRWGEIYNPATGERQGRVTFADAAVVDAAVDAAEGGGVELEVGGLQDLAGADEDVAAVSRRARARVDPRGSLEQDQLGVDPDAPTRALPAQDEIGRAHV